MTEPSGRPVTVAFGKERGMYPLSVEICAALIKERHAEIRRAFERYDKARTACAARPRRPTRLAVLLQRLRRRPIGAEQMPLQWSEHAGPEEQWSA
jgi:hypothetical protein